MPIVKTRLYKPPISRKFIIRERLMARLHEEEERHLILIIASAGYGKSVLMSQWLDTCQGKYTWISLAEDCNDLQLFLSYLTAGIQEHFPGSLQHIAQIIGSNQLPAEEVIAQTLISDLHELSEPLVIVFDDFHKIRNKSLLNVFNQLINFPPQRVRFALISRVDPPLKKAKLLSYKQVCEIRMADLRLRPHEITELAKNSINLDISSETAQEIERITEGWILGVNLTLQDYQKNHSTPLATQLSFDRFGDLEQFFFELFEERVQAEASKLLMVAALFDRFDLGLLEQLFKDSPDPALQGQGLRERFRELQNSAEYLFLIPLDYQKKWYRLHHLIQEILKRRLVQTCPVREIEQYYRIAGAFFAGNGFPDEGIQYFLLGNDEEKAVAIIASNWEELIDHGQNLRLNRWLHMLPAGISEKYPTLLLIRAYLCDTFSNFELMGKCLDQALKLIDEEKTDPRWLGSFAAVHACYSCYTGDIPSTIKHASKALDLLSPDPGFLFDYALNFKVLSLNMTYREAEARELIDRVRLRLEPGDRRRLMRTNVIQLLSDANQARIQDLKHLGQLVIEICEEEKIWWMYKIGNYYLGLYHYLKNQINNVYTYIDAGIHCYFNAGPIWALQLYYTGVLAALARNDLRKAGEYMKMAREFIDINKLESFKGYLHAFEVEFALRTNNLERAWTLNRTANYAIHPPVYYYYIPQLTPIKLFLRKGAADSMKQADELIQGYKEVATGSNNRYTLIQVTLLEALWQHASGLNEKAVHTMSEVLALVRDDEYLRVFLDMGRPVLALLQALPEEEKRTPLIRNILNAFEYEPGIHSLPSDLPEEMTLTSKEREILNLVAEGLQNKEIAGRLFLSESTIRTYLYKAYQKLGVNNRSAAVHKLKKIRQP